MNFNGWFAGQLRCLVIAGRNAGVVCATLAGLCIVESTPAAQGEAPNPGVESRPNILFISLDDLNDWTGCLGGHPQALTPNLDRLAASGILFTNAHAPGASCNSSRTAILTGRSPHKSGLYDNGQPMREVLPRAEILPKTLSRYGYHSAGSGKLLHYFIDAASWDDYFPEASTENPFPRTLYPQSRPLSLPQAGPWQYVETDWGPLDATDEEFGGDVLVADWISKKLSSTDIRQPFFLACGFYRPHEPWFVPQKYFEPFPLESIQLPPGYQENDLDDLPDAGQKQGPNRYFEHIRQHDQWKQAIQGYLASIYFADAMLGRVLDALEKGPHADNTIVVLWSDHGWHLGEKQHWQKYTAWRACTRVPLVIRVPQGFKPLPQGTQPATCDAPVNLLSLFPTLLDLCSLPPETHHDAPSLVPLLKTPSRDWTQPSITFLGDVGSFGLSTRSWRYIRYANGDEELYHIADDPHEWTNLANSPEHQAVLQQLRQQSPQSFAKKPTPSVESLAELKWVEAQIPIAPASRPNGNPFDVHFVNQSRAPVKLFWMGPTRQPKFYSIIRSGQTYRQQTRPGAVWQVCDGYGFQIGHFTVGDRTAKAIIPATVQNPAQR